MDDLEKTEDVVETSTDTTPSENLLNTTSRSEGSNPVKKGEAEEIEHHRASMDDDDDDGDDGPQQGTDSSDDYNEEDIKPVEECPRRTGEEIHDFLTKNWKQFHYPEYMFAGTNDNLNPRENWDKAKLHILVAFYTMGDTRSVSNTHHALYTWAKDRYGDDVFMDFTYFPYEKDVEVFNENNIPIMFGNVSHRPAQDYDVIFDSISVFPEVLNLPRAYKNIGIPLSTEQRLKDNDCPLVFMGGAAAGVAHILTGPVSDNPEDGQSLVDMVSYGPIEGSGDKYMPILFEYAEKGTLKSSKREILEKLARHESQFFYVPSFYRQINDPEHPLRIKGIEKLVDGIPDKIKFNRPVDVSDHSFNWKVFHKSGGNADSMDMPISFGCTGNACSFCEEGTMSGVYREKTFEEIKADMLKSKAHSAANSAGWFSFNLNFHTHINKLIGMISENFSQISLINMRMDELSEGTDLLSLGKINKQIRCSTAIEGASERIRNRVFNKNLSEAQILEAYKNIFEQRFIMIKNGMIRLGAYETEQEILEKFGQLETHKNWGTTNADWDEFLDLVEKAVKLKKEMGCNTALSYTFTPLVVYDNTKLRWMARTSAYESLYGRKTLEYFFEQKKARGLMGEFKQKFNGRGVGTFVEQLLLDLHRPGTKVLIEAVINRGLSYSRNFNRTTADVFMAACEKFGIDYTDIFRARELDEILPSDITEFVTQRKIDQWKEEYKRQDFSARYCLKTKSNPNPKCAGCGMCPTGEAIKKATNRELDHSTLEDVLNEQHVFKPVFYTRFVLDVKGLESMDNKEQLSHYVTSLFLRRDDFLLQNMYKVMQNTCDWNEQDSLKMYSSGKVVYDVSWASIIDMGLLNRLKDEINESGDLRDVKIVSIAETDETSVVKIQDEVSYLIRVPNYSKQSFTDRLLSFNNEVKVFDSKMGPGLTGFKFTKKDDKTIKERIAANQKGQDLYLTMVLPINYHPHALISTLTPLSFEKSVKQTDVVVLDHMKDASMSCPVCGKPEKISLVTGKVVCPYCQNKKILYVVTK